MPARFLDKRRGSRVNCSIYEQFTGDYQQEAASVIDKLGYAETNYPDHSVKWYAVSTNPRCEDIVCHLLVRESFEVFCPKICKKSNTGKEEPLFPGYLFVRLNLDQSDWVKIKYLHGVRRILSFGDTPIPVHKEILTAIAVRMNDSHYSRPALPFKTGDRIRFRKGPFKGLEGIFSGETSGKERVKVLLEAIRCWAFTVEAGIDELSRVD